MLNIANTIQPIWMVLLYLLRFRSTQLLLFWTASLTLTCLYIAQWTSRLPGFLRFVVGVLTGIGVVFFCHFSVWRRHRIRKQLECRILRMTSLTKEDLFSLLPNDAARSASKKKPDQFGWLNIELGRAWPFLNDAISDAVRECLQPMLDEYKMGVLAEIQVPYISFGVANPRFIGVKMEEMGEDEASIEAEMDWKAERETLSVKVKTFGPDFKVEVHNIHVSGMVKIILKPLVDTMPCFGALMVTMTEVPAIHFDLKIAHGDLHALPGVDKMIDNTLRTAIEDSLVWPNRLIFPVLPGDYSFLELKPVGILDVSLIKAANVMNTDILGKSDCFVILYVRKKPELIKRSTTKKNTLNPVWNEGFKIEVYDPEAQKLTIQLMDADSFVKAEFIGRATVPLNKLKPHEPKEMWVDMLENSDMQGGKSRGRVQIVLVYEPFRNGQSASGEQR